ncbi:MAG: CDP-alcohol phosphatidyltransferase family protein [Deltaproteobacteria bacterium]|jgi:phosphatidylglycerophosphate synthase|nr:CDP-alcohol phosphatidyltransferase family protein [Deltaproteobacteria bacterium]
MDYFNEKERAGLLNFASKRDRFFRPVTERLAAWKITPNQVSVFGLLLLISGAICPRSLYPLMMILVILYVVADGLDGCLARYTGKMSEGGALVDAVMDQAGPIIIAAFSTIHIPTVGIWAVLFSSCYIITVALMLYVNSKNIKIVFTVYRVKYIFYIIYALSFIINFDLLTYFMALGSIYYIIIVFLLLKLICKFHEE